jgi:hypothetical protein
MKFGDIEGKGNIYNDSGNVILNSGEREQNSISGLLHRGWVRYKLGWRTIMFKGYGRFHFTNKRLIYLEKPEYIEKIHTFNIDHELGDFGGWEYQAHRLRRAAALQALMFFELRYDEITKFKHDKEYSTVFNENKEHKYKLIVERSIGKELEMIWGKMMKIPLM